MLDYLNEMLEAMPEERLDLIQSLEIHQKAVEEYDRDQISAILETSFNTTMSYLNNIDNIKLEMPMIENDLTLLLLEACTKLAKSVRTFEARTIQGIRFEKDYRYRLNYLSSDHARVFGSFGSFKLYLNCKNLRISFRKHFQEGMMKGFIILSETESFKFSDFSIVNEEYKIYDHTVQKYIDFIKEMDNEAEAYYIFVDTEYIKSYSLSLENIIDGKSFPHDFSQWTKQEKDKIKGVSNYRLANQCLNTSELIEFLINVGITNIEILNVKPLQGPKFNLSKLLGYENFKYLKILNLCINYWGYASEWEDKYGISDVESQLYHSRVQTVKINSFSNPSSWIISMYDLL